MKTIKILLPVIVSFVFAAVCAQDQKDIFRVLASSGDVTIFCNNKWSPVYTSNKVHEGDKIKLGENSYVGLIHNKGNTIELKKPGSYNVNQLAEKLTTANSGLAHKYASYVVGEMAKSDDKDLNKGHYKYMAVTGAVERSTGAAAIKLLAPNETEVLNSTITLRWIGIENAKAYVVKITNRFEETVFSQVTSGTVLKIDLNNLGTEEHLHILTVSVKENPKIKSGQYALNHINNEKASSLENTLSTLKRELKQETAINKIIMASFYEQNKLFLDAISAYEEAIIMEPEVYEYKLAYSMFLNRIGLGEYYKFE